MGKVKNTVKLEQVLELPKDEIEKWNKLIESDYVDYEANGFKELSTVWCKTVKFEDGFEVDLKVCTDGKEDGTLWSEAVLFDDRGFEYSHTDVCDGIDGVFDLSFFDDDTHTMHEYRLNVVEATVS